MMRDWWKGNKHNFLTHRFGESCLPFRALKITYHTKKRKLQNIICIEVLTHVPVDLWNKDNNELDCPQCSSDWIPIHRGSTGWIVRRYSVRRSRNYCVCSKDRHSLEYRRWSLSALLLFQLCPAVSFRLLVFDWSVQTILAQLGLCTGPQGTDCWLKLIYRDRIRLSRYDTKMKIRYIWDSKNKA